MAPSDPRNRGFRDRTAVADVWAWIDARTRPLAAEPVPLAALAGRVTASEIRADGPIPRFDRAAMDGFAIRGEETFGSDTYTPAVFAIVGRSRPGQSVEGLHVGPGEAVAIATGAPMPPGADAVAKVETTRTIGTQVFVSEPVPPGRHVSRVGEDVQAGTVVLTAGRLLRPSDLAALSALGRSSVDVVRRPRAAILVTGDELLPAGEPGRASRIADANSPMLSALVDRDGGVAEVVGPVPDDPDRLRDLIPRLAAGADLLMISGGTSTGPEDHAPGLVADLGELAIHGVSVRPASPTGLGVVAGTPVLLLPGNPVSCLCAYDLFGARLVRRLGGRAGPWSYRGLTLPLADKLTSPIGRLDYARVRIEGGRVVPLAAGGAAILSSVTRADGFVIVPANLEGYPAGAPVAVWLYDDQPPGGDILGT